MQTQTSQRKQSLKLGRAVSVLYLPIGHSLQALSDVDPI